MTTIMISTKDLQFVKKQYEECGKDNFIALMFIQVFDSLINKSIKDDNVRQQQNLINKTSFQILKDYDFYTVWDIDDWLESMSVEAEDKEAFIKVRNALGERILKIFRYEAENKNNDLLESYKRNA